MPHPAQDRRLPTFVVDRIAQGFAINGETLILLPVVGIPPRQRAVEGNGIGSDKNVAKGAFAGNNPNPLVDPTAKAFTCLGPQILDPTPDRLIALHATQGRSGGQREHHMLRMAPPLSAARIGNVFEVMRQCGHVFDADHDLGGLLAVVLLDEGT